MNWENIIIELLVFSPVVYLIKSLQKSKSNCGDDICNCE